MADRRPGRLVPRDLDAYPDLEKVAERHGWPAVEPGGADGWEMSWQAGDGTVLRWYEDPATGVEYAVAEGPDAAAVADTVQAEVPLLTPANYADVVAAQTTAAGTGRMLYAVATAAGPGFDRAAFDVLAAAIADGDPLVRRQAVIAASIPGWSQFRPLVERARDGDPDPAVRRDAAAAAGKLTDPGS